MVALSLPDLKAKWSWENFARPEQLEPPAFRDGNASGWLIRTGRGWGKTRTGAETVIKRVQENRNRRIALVGATAADVRDTMIDELEQFAGIMSCSPPWFKPKYEASKRRIVWPNGAVAFVFSAEEPARLRGPQFDFAWCDELAAWPRQTVQEAWSNLMFGLRHGNAQFLATTTPKPTSFMRTLLKRKDIIQTRGSTYDNAANLSQKYFEAVIKPYEGTRVGQQELMGDLLEDTPDALWVEDDFEIHRVEEAPELVRIGISVDPAGAEEGHEIGITVGGVDANDHGFLLADLSLNGTPDRWATQVIDAYDEWDADFIVVETNYGGEMVIAVLQLKARDLGHKPLNIKTVKATRGKYVRAEPISGLYQQGRIHHVGRFEILENQSLAFTPGSANDRVDANVWLWTYLLDKRVKKLPPTRDLAQEFEKRLINRAHREGVGSVMGSLWRKSF